MFCKKCGSEFGKEFKFCTNCGSMLESDSEIAATQNEFTTNSQEGFDQNNSVNDNFSKVSGYAKSAYNDVKSGNAVEEIRQVIVETLKNPIKGSAAMVDKISDSTINVMLIIIGAMPILYNILNPPREIGRWGGSGGDIDFTQLILKIIGAFVGIAISYAILTVLIDKDKKQEIGERGVMKIYGIAMMPFCAFTLISMILSFISGLLVSSLSGIGFYTALLMFIGKISRCSMILFGVSIYSMLDNKKLSTKKWLGVLVLLICMFIK